GAGAGFEGAAFIFLGDPNGITAADPFTAWTVLRGGAHDVELGEKVASAGDVNGDGYGDVIVLTDISALIFLGGPDGIRDGTPAFADTVISSVGNRVDAASAGDVNGDGYSDVIVSSFEGAWIFLGGPAGIASGTPASAATTLTVPGQAITSAVSAGDV